MQRPAATRKPIPSPGADVWGRILGGGWIFLLLIGLVLVFGLLRPAQFGSTYNLSMLAVNAAILLVLSVGQTFVIIAAGIDLSVGAVLVFASITSAQVDAVDVGRGRRHLRHHAGRMGRGRRPGLSWRWSAARFGAR